MVADLLVLGQVQSRSVQSLSHVRLFETQWTVACQASLSITISWSLVKLMSIESVMPIQPSHPLSSPSDPAFNLLQHQDLFQWFSSSHQVAIILELQLQSFQWIFRVDCLQDRLDWFLCCPWVFEESSPAPVFESINSLVLSLLYSPTLISVQHNTA